jgi:quercetin dioxygenase-like cupin family protein
MAKTIFIDTNKLPRKSTPQGEVTEILNESLAGAKNVLGCLRWIKPGERFEAKAADRHQLVYLMEGKGAITLDNKRHEVSKGMGVYLACSESAAIEASPGNAVKLLHLVVPRIPK